LIVLYSCVFLHGKRLLAASEGETDAASAQRALHGVQALQPARLATLQRHQHTSSDEERTGEDSDTQHTPVMIAASARSTGHPGEGGAVEESEDTGVETSSLATTSSVLQLDAVAMVAVAAAQALGLLSSFYVGLARSPKPLLDIVDTATYRRPALLLLPADESLLPHAQMQRSMTRALSEVLIEGLRKYGRMSITLCDLKRVVLPVSTDGHHCCGFQARLALFPRRSWASYQHVILELVLAG